MPMLLAEGVVKPNKVKIVEGKTLLAEGDGCVETEAAERGEIGLAYC